MFHVQASSETNQESRPFVGFVFLGDHPQGCHPEMQFRLDLASSQPPFTFGVKFSSVIIPYTLGFMGFGIFSMFFGNEHFGFNGIFFLRIFLLSVLSLM